MDGVQIGISEDTPTPPFVDRIIGISEINHVAACLRLRTDDTKENVTVQESLGKGEGSGEMTVRGVVIDTSVFVAAGFRPRSDSRRIIDSVRAGALRLVWNDETRDETKALLDRIPPLSWDAVSSLFREEQHFPDMPSDEFLVVEDPEDRKFAALAACADVTLLSLDRHLLDAALRDRCTVRRPGDFLRRSAIDLRPNIGKEVG